MMPPGGEPEAPIFQPVVLQRIDPGKRLWRHYRLEIWHGLFGGWLLVRQWGRLRARGGGQIQRQHFGIFPEAEATMARLVREKRRRGYRTASEDAER